MLHIRYIHDDLCVFGKTKKEHDHNLLNPMKVPFKDGIIFKTIKCQIKNLQITFYDTVFSAEGMKQNPEKIQCVTEMPPPAETQRLQSCLGMINSYRFTHLIFLTTQHLYENSL